MYLSEQLEQSLYPYWLSSHLAPSIPVGLSHLDSLVLSVLMSRCRSSDDPGVVVVMRTGPVGSVVVSVGSVGMVELVDDVSSGCVVVVVEPVGVS